MNGVVCSSIHFYPGSLAKLSKKKEYYQREISPALNSLVVNLAGFKKGKKRQNQISTVLLATFQKVNKSGFLT